MSLLRYSLGRQPVALGSDEFIRALLGEQNTGPRFLGSSDVIHVQTIYPDGIPRMLFELLQLSEQHISYEFLLEILEDAPITQWWDECSNSDWDGMGEIEILRAMTTAVDLWTAAIKGMYTAVDLIAPEFQDDGQTNRVFQKRLEWILLNLYDTLGLRVASGSRLVPTVASKRRHPKELLETFSSLAALVSNLEHVWSGEDDLELGAIIDLPSRHTVLEAIIRNAPSIEQLDSSIAGLLSNDPDQTCAICLTAFDEWSGLPANHEHNKWWITNSAAYESLFINVGYEQVPLQMPCGHTFCAKCIETWLDQPGRLQCPFRDDEYGIHRHGVLPELEMLGEGHRKAYSMPSSST